MNSTADSKQNAPQIRRGWQELRVCGIVDETADTKTFFFVDHAQGNKPFEYIAGQYLTFRYDTIGTKPLVRSYTMSSAPRDPDRIAVTVKRVAGGIVSNWMCDVLKIGDVLRARGPIGKFCYRFSEDEQRLVFIAAGSGVTPFVSMMKQLAPELGTAQYPTELCLLVSFRTPADIICKKELFALRQLKNVKIYFSFSREASTDPRDFFGRIDQTLIDRAVGPDFTGATFFTCGPDEMMALTATHLRNCGVMEKNIKMESFSSN